MPFLNQSELQKFKGWPIRKKYVDDLLSNFDSISIKVKQSVGLYSSLNRVRLVHQSERPDFRMQLVFKKAAQTKSGWRIPFQVRVYNQERPDKSFEINFEHSGMRPAQKEQPKAYILWRYVLTDYKNRFPYQEIPIKLFSSQP